MERRDFLRLLGMGTVLPLTEALPRVAGPSGRRIDLIDCYVAGFQYYDGVNAEAVANLCAGQRLVLQREPANPHDDNAIAIHTPAGHKLGYIPRQDNPVIAAIVDQQVPVGIELVFLDRDAPPWDRALVKVYQLI